MKLEDISKLAVIGAGMMGAQIAELLARTGYQVVLVDISDELVEKGLQSIDNRLERFFVAKGKLTAEQKQEILGRIKGNSSIEESAKDVDFVIEAATENVAIKKDILGKLDNNAPSGTILASNTSFQNISEIASATQRQDRVAGVHFFNPVNSMKLVEVVRGANTSDETIQVASDLVKKLGKEPVVCRDSSYGFLANRAYTAMLNEAVQMLWERVAPPEEIDKALKLGYNLPMGPIELFDFVAGWALLVSSEQDAIRELGPDKGRLHPLIRMMHRAGYSKMYDFWNDVVSKW